MSSTSASIHARRELARIPRSSGLNLHRRRGKGKESKREMGVERGMEEGKMEMGEGRWEGEMWQAYSARRGQEGRPTYPTSMVRVVAPPAVS